MRSVANGASSLADAAGPLHEPTRPAGAKGSRYSRGWALTIGPPMTLGNAAVGGIAMRGLLGPIVVVSLLLLLVGVSPRWSYSSGWGYYPSGGIALVLIVVFAVFAMRRI